MSNTMMAQDTQNWVEKNAALVDAVRPWWADAERVVLDYRHGEVESIVFIREVGEVTIEQWFTHTAGALSVLDEPRVCLTGDDSEEASFTPERAARVAVGLIAAAVALGSDATVSDLRSAALDAGIATGDVFAATGGNL